MMREGLRIFLVSCLFPLGLTCHGLAFRAHDLWGIPAVTAEFDTFLADSFGQSLYVSFLVRSVCVAHA